MKQVVDSYNCFSSELVTIEDISKGIQALNASKATQTDDIPIKTIKKNSDIFSKLFQANFSKVIGKSTFP